MTEILIRKNAFRNFGKSVSRNANPVAPTASGTKGARNYTPSAHKPSGL